MRVAALYDVHGNLPALEAVLAEPSAARRRDDRRQRRRPRRGADAVGVPRAARSATAPTFVRRGNCDRNVLEHGERRRRLVRRPSSGRAPARSWPTWPLVARARRRRRRRDVLPCDAARDDELVTRLTPDDAARGGARRRRRDLVVVRAHARAVRPASPGGRRLVNAGSVGRPYEGAAGRVLGAARATDVELLRTDYDVETRRGRDPGDRTSRTPRSIVDEPARAAGCPTRRPRTSRAAVARSFVSRGAPSRPRHAASSGSGRSSSGSPRSTPTPRSRSTSASDVELLISVMLSAQTTDVNVNRVTEKLFVKYRKPGGLPRGAGRGARAGHLPDRLLPAEDEVDPRCDAHADRGVRRRRCRARSRSCCGCPAWRARRPTSSPPSSATRRGSSSTRTCAGSRSGSALTREEDPVKIERDLVKIVPQADWHRFPHLVIWHGRRVCDARKPRCEVCVLADLCPSSSVGRLQRHR